ncbi:MAG: hypothetical protein QOE24_2204 [Frankiales bacterium]|nr:hypothetical protein [Frankiales bacterium]
MWSWHSRHSARAVVAASLLAASVGSVAAPGLLTAAAHAASSPVVTGDTRPFEPADDGPDLPAPRSNAPSHVPASHVPQVTGLPVTAAPGSRAVDGLTMRDQRSSEGGNAFSLEPPDQALCVGTTEIIEGVNNVFATYAKSGGALTSGPMAYSPFWNNGTPEVTRDAAGHALSYGPFVSDPKCYFDPGLGRFYLSELQISTDPATGALTDKGYVNIAVSRTSTPGTAAADWYLYRLDVSNDGTGGTPSHTGCPCFGDQPLIGADRYGFYVTTNEFSIAGSAFNGAQLYAFDKTALAAGTMKVQRLESNAPALAEGLAYSVQPATSPTAADWSGAANGTEFLSSALDFAGKLDNRIAIWAISNTASLATASPAVTLTSHILSSEVYGQPPKAQQKAGPIPLGDAVKAKENLLDTNDDRMNQAVYANGRLYSGLNTVVKTQNFPTTTGIAYFVVTPTASAGTVSGAITGQGYVAVNGNTVMYPSIAVPHGSGRPGMVFTLVGPGYYPSTALVRLTPAGAVDSPVAVSFAGTRPADGFTGYPAYGGGGIERWGDYSAAVADTNGRLWFAGEYIPGTFGWGFGGVVPKGNPPGPYWLANWGTGVSSVS